ncbi:hypothetical protein [Sphingomonas sp. KR3-1]|uniref:hypothetical protein n=1 Tax=Sphingomonas sp. KR3-1 TaxID=3156611 RepID=UPI0032B4FE05
MNDIEIEQANGGLSNDHIPTFPGDPFPGPWDPFPGPWDPFPGPGLPGPTFPLPPELPFN